MYLTNKQHYKYKNLIDRIAHTQCVLQVNGIFDIYNVSKIDADKIVRDLKAQDFIADVNKVESGKYNFNKFDFSQGFASPEKYYNIRGLLKEENLTEALELHDTLNPKIWTEDNELISEVKAKILQIVAKFKSLLAQDGVDLKVDDIYLLGSNANYNYNEDSDLDIHIIADESFDCSEEHLAIIYNAYKSLFNKKYTITIKGINVELYVENKDKVSHISSGVYSFNNGWIKQPSRFEIPEINQFAVDRGVKLWEDKYFDVTLNPSITKIDKYIDDIYKLRQDSVVKDGEFGEGNLVFKEIRRLGYLDDLKDLKTELTSKELSLESLTKIMESLSEPDLRKVASKLAIKVVEDIIERQATTELENDYLEAIDNRDELERLLSLAQEKENPELISVLMTFLHNHFGHRGSSITFLENKK